MQRSCNRHKLIQIIQTPNQFIVSMGKKSCLTSLQRAVLTLPDTDSLFTKSACDVHVTDINSDTRSSRQFISSTLAMEKKSSIASRSAVQSDSLRHSPSPVHVTDVNSDTRSSTPKEKSSTALRSAVQALPNTRSPHPPNPLRFM